MSKYDGDVKKYRMVYDIHTHTTFSHGKGSIEDNVKAALERGLSIIGIADHGPGHLTYGVKRKDLPVMREEIRRLQPLYPKIQILLGVEANIINPSGKLDITEKEANDLDYILAGYHYGVLGERPLATIKTHLCNLAAARFGTGENSSQKRINTELVIKALHENRIKALTHPGDKGPFDLMPIAKACEETGTLMEINIWHNAPSAEELKKLAATGVRFIIGSDAHSPRNVGKYEPALKRAFEAGVDPARIVNVEEV
ncbi:MAG TPA: PHP domain-containing protein [Bacillota bacterium]|jgi:putative hydrolase|nr:phosphoesterase [Clostridiales bacterium UBA9856]HOA43125.1 PHP domain-containing protein [Bacillota bacterium]HQC82381.1 PHP domain-containing protein [Bacillota bacterium]